MPNLENEAAEHLELGKNAPEADHTKSHSAQMGIWMNLLDLSKPLRMELKDDLHAACQCFQRNISPQRGFATDKW